MVSKIGAEPSEKKLLTLENKDKSNAVMLGQTWADRTSGPADASSFNGQRETLKKFQKKKKEIVKEEKLNCFFPM